MQSCLAHAVAILHTHDKLQLIEQSCKHITPSKTTYHLATREINLCE